MEAVETNQNTKKISIKALEKAFFIGGAIVLLAVGLFWNLFSDITLKKGSGDLFIGLLTCVIGGILILIGTTINNFDVKIKGIILEVGGILLASALIIFLSFALGDEFARNEKVIFNIVSIIICIVGVILGACSSIAALVFQIIRLRRNEE